MAVRDAQELAPEFAKAPTTTETRFEAKLVISQEPLFDLLKWGHANPKIQECIIKYMRPAYNNLDRLREEMETERMERMGFQDEATLYRDEAAWARAKGESIRQEYQSQTSHHVLLSSEALDRIEGSLELALSAHDRAHGQTEKLAGLFRNFKHRRKTMRNIDRFLMALMDGRITPVPGNESFAQFFIDLRGNVDVTFTHTEVYYLFIYLLYGNPKIPRSIPPVLAAKYWPEQLEEAYMQENLEQLKEAERQGKVDQRQVQYFMNERMKKYREGKFSFESYPTARVVKKEVTIFEELRRGYVPTNDEITLHDLPPRVLSASEIDTIKKLCYKELCEGQPKDIDTNRMLRVISDLVEFCNLLSKPENHVKVQSGQYVEKPVHVRPVHDLTDEMAQEFSNLPRFTAYAKIIQDQGGRQMVSKCKMQTLKLTKSELGEEDLTHLPEMIDMLIGVSKHYKRRTQIEEEIRQRLEKWRKGRSDEPPPTHY